MIEELERTRAALWSVAPFPPAHYADMLGPYTTLVVDKGCRKPIGWGFPITRKVTDEEVAGLKTRGDVEWLSPDTFGLVVRWLGQHEAEKLYGPPGPVRWGPRGGFLGVTYGPHEFNHRKMKPCGAVPPGKPSGSETR